MNSDTPTGASIQPDLSQPVRDWLYTFVTASASTRPESVAALFSDVFLSADPTTLVTVPKTAFASALPGRRDLFRSAAASTRSLSPGGASVIAVIHPRQGEHWVGMFPAGGLGGVSGAFATPSAQHLCVAADGLAFLVRTDAPQESALVAQDQVRQVAVASTTLLLLVRDIDSVAVGARGVAWRSPRLAVDDLRVTTAGPTAIHCTGDFLAGRDGDLIVDVATGCVTSGPRLDGPPWNPRAYPPPEATF